MSGPPKRLGVLISGRGSNLRAIQNAIDSGIVAGEIAVVISNRVSAQGLEWARECGIPTVTLSAAGLEREQFDLFLRDALREAAVDLVCLAGYMRLLSAPFVRAFEKRILNIHPSLLPSFPGLDAQYQALQHGAKITGCTVHFVDEFLDAGPIVMQAAVPVLDRDTVDTLSMRILAEEHRLFPLAIAAVLNGDYRIEGRRVLLPGNLDQRSDSVIIR